MKKETTKLWGLSLILALCSTTVFSACSSSDDSTTKDSVSAIADKVTRLAAPLLNEPFTHGEIGVLMQKGQEDLMNMVNNTIHQMKSDGTLRSLHEKYGLVYAY